MNTTTRSGSDRLLLSTRVALAIGFGGLLAIMALAGADGLRDGSVHAEDEPEPQKPSENLEGRDHVAVDLHRAAVDGGAAHAAVALVDGRVGHVAVAAK